MLFRAPTQSPKPASLRRRLFHLGWPIIMQLYLFQLTGVVDNLMVGQFGEATIAALGICVQLNFFMVLTYAALTQGGAVMTAQFLGARQLDALRETIATLLLAGLLIGLLLASLYWFAGEWLLSLLTTDLFKPESERSGLPALGYEYLSVISIGVLFMVVGQIAMHLLQALGDTRTPMRWALYGNLLNVVGNYLVLFGGAIPGITEAWFEPMGLRGVALATSLAWALQTVMMVRVLLRHPKVALTVRDLQTLVWRRLGRVLHIGYPLSIDGFLWQGSAFLYAMMFNWVGPEAYAAFLVALVIRSLSLAPGGGFQQAISIAVGQALGGRHVKRARAFVGTGLKLVCLILPGLGFLLWVLSPLYLNLYDITEQTRHNIIWMIGLGFAYSLATSVTIIIPGVLRAGGDTRAPMIITGLGFSVFGLPLAWWLGIHLGWGLWGVFAGFVADEVAKSVMMLVYLRRETWLNNLTR